MRFARHRSESPAPDMTPMVDVVFLLLIFFLTTTQMAQSARTQVELPDEEGSAGEESARSALVINVDHLGAFLLMDDAVSGSELVRRARDVALANPEAVPVVRADRRAPSARLNQAMEALREAGFERVRLATSPEAR